MRDVDTTGVAVVSNLTRTDDFPAEAASLVALFDSCAANFEVETVFNASMNMTAWSIGSLCRSKGMNQAEMVKYIREQIVLDLIKIVVANWERSPNAADVPVRAN